MNCKRWQLIAGRSTTGISDEFLLWPAAFLPTTKHISLKIALPIWTGLCCVKTTTSWFCTFLITWSTNSIFITTWDQLTGGGWKGMGGEVTTLISRFARLCFSYYWVSQLVSEKVTNRTDWVAQLKNMAEQSTNSSFALPLQELWDKMFICRVCLLRLSTRRDFAKSNWNFWTHYNLGTV